MKKTMKRILCMVFILVLCLSASGCKELDRARAHHAILQEDGSIMLNGKAYLPLPYCEEFTPPMGRDVEVVKVTKADVPVLLKEYFYETVLLLSEDTRILGEEGQYYCVEDDYEDLRARIEGGFFLVDMRYTYTGYDDEIGYLPMDYVLTEVQKNTVRRVLASVEPRMVESFNSDYMVSLYEADVDGWFQRSLCDIGVYNEQYALIFWDERGITVFDVPLEYNDIFADVMNAYISGF